MEYGQGGTTSGYSSHKVGTGGYAQVIFKSDEQFPDYDYYVDSDNYYAVK